MTTPQVSAGMGTWKNPPLAYVVAEIAISPYYEIKAALPKLQSALRADYPRTIEGIELQLSPNQAPETRPIWRLISAEQTRGVQLGMQSISLHATAYSTSDDFLERLGRLLAVVSGADLGVFVERAGLRYIDFILPAQSRAPQDYIVEGARGISVPDGGKVASCITACNFRKDDCVVQVRVAAPAPAGMIFPPEFQPMPLKKSSALASAERESSRSNPIGFIDTDCICELSELFERDRLAKVFKKLHTHASETFKSLVSPMAKEEWQ